MTSRATIVDGDRAVDVDAVERDGAVFLSPADLELATGWVLRPEGLCRGDVCVPVRSDRLSTDDGVDLAVFAEIMQRPFAFEPAPAIAVLGDAAADRAEEMATLHAPDFTLPDVDGGEITLGEHSGRKRVLLAWASWCGCRWDLPVWQQLYDELAPDGLELIAIALDEDVELARQCVRDESPVPLTYPVAVDRDHRVAEKYGIINVPTTIWIDEDDNIVRPPAIAPADDKYKDFTQVESGLHHDELRRWVRDGELPLDDDALHDGQRGPTAEVQAARAERRLAAYLLRADRREAAERHFVRAIELAPHDWTIQRGSMPLRGEDPFGQAFFDFYEQWESAGRPSYGS
jgi:peroxiredoxin